MMYKQMKKFITSAIIAVTLLFMVTANAYALLTYGYTGQVASGSFTLECEAWDDGSATKDELVTFDFLGYGGTVYDENEVVIFGVDLESDVLRFRANDPSRYMFMNNFDAVIERGGWTVTVSELDIDASNRVQYVGAWGLVSESCEPEPGPPAAVPEPATLSLLGIGLVGLVGGAARKKFKKKAMAKT